MITNTELEQLTKLDRPMNPGEEWTAIHIGTQKIAQVSRELLCAREVIKSVKYQRAMGYSIRTDKNVEKALNAYDALCAPQEKTGDVK